MAQVINKEGQWMEKLTIYKEDEHIIWCVNFKEKNEKTLAVFSDEKFASHVAEALKQYKPKF